jgi:hypothetical protein
MSPRDDDSPRRNPALLVAHATFSFALFPIPVMTVRGLQGPILVTAMQEDAPDVDRAGMDAALGALAGVFAATGLTALALFSRAHRL